MVKKFKPIFERTLSEQSELIRPQVALIERENLRQGLYNSYRDSRYSSQDTFVRQYNNHKEVVRINASTGQTKVIKLFK